VRRRILVSILLVIATTVLALGLPLAIVSWRLVDDLLHQELAGRLQSMEASLGGQPQDETSVDLGSLRVGIPADGTLTIRDPDGSTRSTGALRAGDSYAESVVLPGGGRLELSVPMARLRAERWRALLLVAAAVLLSTLVATGVALVLARRLSTPLSDVARRAARLGAGDFRTVARRYRIAELDRVADVLDASATDIAALLGRERDLAGDISHQLRTRLTGLRLRLEELAEHPDPAVVHEVEAALEQTDRLVTVVDDLLAHARSQRAAGATELSLAAELTGVENEFAGRMTAAGRSLTIACSPDLVVRATPGRLREALGALVDNGLQHGGGVVAITARRTAGTVVIEVTDEGPGVPTAIIGHVFDRGISTASSTGIGLGLARALIEADGGRLELRRPSPPVFAVFLTAATADAGGRPVGSPVDADGQRDLGAAGPIPPDTASVSGVSSSGKTQRR
jgi:signal transduction histidine kinase